MTLLKCNQPHHVVIISCVVVRSVVKNVDGVSGLGVDDVIKFDNLRLAFEVVQVPQNMVEGIFAVLSSVLWLGNLVFRVSFQDGPRLT